MLRSHDIESMLSGYGEVSAMAPVLARRLRTHASFNAVRLTLDDIKAAANFLRMETRRIGPAITVKAALKIVSSCHGFSGWDEARMRILDRESGWSVDKPIWDMVRPGQTLVHGGSEKDRSVMRRLIEVSFALSSAKSGGVLRICSDVKAEPFVAVGAVSVTLSETDLPEFCGDRVEITKPGVAMIRRSGERPFRVCFYDPEDEIESLRSALSQAGDEGVGLCLDYLASGKGSVVVCGPAGTPIAGTAAVFSAAWRAMGVNHGVVPVRDAASASAFVADAVSARAIGIMRTAGLDPAADLEEKSGMPAPVPLMTVLLGDREISVSFSSP